MRYLHPQWFMEGRTRVQTRHPEYAAQGRLAIGEVWEMYGPRVDDLYRVFALSEDGFIGNSRDLDGATVCREFYVRLCDLEAIGEGNLLYVLPRR